MMGYLFISLESFQSRLCVFESITMGHELQYKQKQLHHVSILCHHHCSSSFQKRAYKSYAKALPGLKKIGISSVLLRKIIGSLEVGCGVVLTLVPGKPKDVANFLLLLVMLAVLFFHQLVGDPLKRYAHALVFGILLTCRLLIARQSDERPEREESREEPHINEQEKNKVKQS